MKTQKNNKQEFSIVLIKARMNQKLTQANIASQIGVSQSAYNYWEQGKHKPKNSLIFKLCEVLNISIKDLIF